ncbi:MAG: hypothetical protein QXO12_01765 [Candidatus Pacearchaeota archaeon]
MVNKKILLILIFLLFFSFSCIKKEKEFNFNGFNYSIINYGKTNEGKNIIVYLTKIYFPDKDIIYNLYLRYDPRKNNVPIQINNLKEIKALTYIAFDKKFENKKCAELTLAGFRLGEFLYVLGVKKEVAIFDETNSTFNEKYITITNYNFSEENNLTLIILKYGDEEKVYNINNTIIIQSNDCNILQAVEKFILFVIERLKNLNTIKPL